MNLFAMNCCRQLRYKLCYNINHTIRQCSHKSGTQMRNLDKAVESQKFPGYKVIYKFPYVIPAYILNKTRRNYTVCYVASIPIIVVGQMMDIISVDTSIALLQSGFLLGLLLHGNRLFNNLVGSIVYKEKDQKLAISYINYWGKRLDFVTGVDDVILLERHSRFNKNPLFRYLLLKSSDKKLRLFMKCGACADETNFQKIFNKFM